MDPSKPSPSRWKRWAKKSGLLRNSGGATERDDGRSSQEAVIPLGQAKQFADTQGPATIPTDQLGSNATLTTSQDQTANTPADKETSASPNDRSPSASKSGAAPGFGDATKVQASASDSLWEQALKRIRTSDADPDIIAAVLNSVEQPAGGESGSSENSAKDIKRLMEQHLAEIETNQKTRAWKIRIHGTSYSVGDFVDRTITVLNRFVAVGDVAVSFDPVHAALPWAAVRFVLVNLTARSKMSSEITFGLAKVTTLVFQCSIYQTVYTASKGPVESQDVLRQLEETIAEVYVQSLLFLGFAVQQSGGNHFTAVFKLDDMETHNQNLLDIGEKLSRAAENCEKFSSHQNRQSVSEILQLAKDSHSALQTQGAILLDIRKYTLLSTLRHAKGAAYDFHANENDPRCHPDTRVELLDQIQQWVDSDDAEPIFWLQGMAGTGKSTIARTVAERLDAKGELGANFFFKRGEGDRSRAAYFFTTISQHLCQRVPSFAEHVQHAIEADPNITERSISQQFEKLIMQPLETLSQRESGKSRMTVVIDALDECDLEEDVKRIIGLLARTQSLPGFKLKFFLTSRPEYHIRLGFDKLEVRSHKDVALHTIPEPVVEHDLSVYLVHQLTHIRDEYNRMAPEEFHLPRDWPPTGEVQKLVNMAVPLFIFAATVCRLLEDMAPSNPADELTKILMRPAGTSDEKLTATYAPVLDRLVTGKHGSRMSSRQRADIVSRFKNIIGSLILLAEPLSIISLANLLGVSRSTVDGIVNSLHSVLRVPRDLSSPVKTFHLSFREFLVDRDGDVPEDIWIDEEKTNEELGIKCLELLSRDSHLQYDMCDLGELAKRRSTIPQEKLDSSLSPEVQYACLYWIHHLKEGNAILRDGEQAHEFLKKHFLHWLEALSLMGRLPESIRLTQELQTLVDPNEGTKIMEFLHDAQRFILRFRAIGDQAPLQFYSSALLFAPENSVIKKTFQNYITWIRQKPTMEDDWNPCLQTLEGHDGIVNAVAFSRDGRSIASGSHDNIVNLWDTTTGELRHTLRGHENTVKCVALSGDGQLVASGSYDCTVKVWNVATGDVEHTFQGHKNKVQSVAFSINDRSVISGSDDSTVKIWDLATGALRLSLEAHNDAVESVACANNGRLIASGSRDKKINLWDASTGELQRNLEGHSGIVRGVVFSPDSALLASRSKDKSIRIWDVKSGALQLRIKGNSGPSLAFSSDGKFIASEKNNMVVIRDVVSGEIYQTLQGHSREVTCVAYSASGGLLGSASFDNTVKIWDTKSRSSEQSPEGHSSEVLSLAISPDSRLLTSGSGDNSVKVWDAASGKLKHSLEDHTARIKAVSFSPNSSLIASASEDDSIKLWDAETGSLQQSLNRRLRMAQVLAFSPDSLLLATSVDASELAVWNIDDGDGTHFQLSDNAGASAQQLAFSPDSTLVAAADWGHTNVWDVGKRRRLYTFKGPSGRPLWMGFSPNSKVLGLRFESKPNCIKIWDMLSGLSRQAHQEHGLTTFKTVFSADSKTLEITSWNTDQELLVREELDCEVGTPDSTSPDGSSTMLTSRVETSKPRSYRLDAQKTWIQRDGQNLLWIPPDYRPTAYSLVLQLRNWAADDSENRVAIGSASGRVLIIAFDS